jgi:hypothetical protein
MHISFIECINGREGRGILDPWVVSIPEAGSTRTKRWRSDYHEHGLRDARNNLVTVEYRLGYVPEISGSSRSD